MRANHHIVANGVVHLVAILCEDARSSGVPNRVLVHQSLVAPVHCDAHLLRVDHCIPLEYAFWALAKLV